LLTYLPKEIKNTEIIKIFLKNQKEESKNNGMKEDANK
jgi:hypothetical protein